MVDMHLKMETGNVYAPKLQPYFVVYSVSGFQEGVPPSVYDSIFYVSEGNLGLHTDLNLNGHSILGLKHRYIIQGFNDKNIHKSKFFSYNELQNNNMGVLDFGG